MENPRHLQMDAPLEALKKHFGYTSFRGRQEEAIRAVLAGEDCFCVMPTGGGKSMCYEIPALVKPGIVLVVSPLIALMQNQVAALQKRRIPAEFLSSAQTASKKNQVYAELDSGKPRLRLLYVTPETLCMPHFIGKLKKLHGRGLLTLVAVDEAHCISSWGHDFRPSYRKLSVLREHFASVPLLALTATAVAKVREDVIRSLQLRVKSVLMSSFNRPNIFYEVRYKDLLDAYKDLRDELRACAGQCAIVYCQARNTCDDVGAKLRADGVNCRVYHAGLKAADRSSALEEWCGGKVPVIIATIAFGMGIDRGIVRLVLHFNVPKSLEGFYQESGRAGRDQRPSRSIVYYGVQDKRNMEFLIKREEATRKGGDAASRTTAALQNFGKMVEYCESTTCRRVNILSYFGEQATAVLCGQTCDCCKFPRQVAEAVSEIRSGGGDGYFCTRGGGDEYFCDANVDGDEDGGGSRGGGRGGCGGGRGIAGGGDGGGGNGLSGAFRHARGISAPRPLKDFVESEFWNYGKEEEEDEEEEEEEDEIDDEEDDDNEDGMHGGVQDAGATPAIAARGGSSGGGGGSGSRGGASVVDNIFDEMEKAEKREEQRQARRGLGMIGQLRQQCVQARPSSVSTPRPLDNQSSRAARGGAVRTGGGGGGTSFGTSYGTSRVGSGGKHGGAKGGWTTASGKAISISCNSHGGGVSKGREGARSDADAAAAAAAGASASVGAAACAGASASVGAGAGYGGAVHVAQADGGRRAEHPRDGDGDSDRDGNCNNAAAGRWMTASSKTLKSSVGVYNADHNTRTREGAGVTEGSGADCNATGRTSRGRARGGMECVKAGPSSQQTLLDRWPVAGSKAVTTIDNSRAECGPLGGREGVSLREGDAVGKVVRGKEVGTGATEAEMGSRVAETTTRTAEGRPNMEGTLRQPLMGGQVAASSLPACQSNSVGVHGRRADPSGLRERLGGAAMERGPISEESGPRERAEMDKKAAAAATASLWRQYASRGAIRSTPQTAAAASSATATASAAVAARADACRASASESEERCASHDKRWKQTARRKDQELLEPAQSLGGMMSRNGIMPRSGTQDAERGGRGQDTVPKKRQKLLVPLPPPTSQTL